MKKLGLMFLIVAFALIAVPSSGARAAAGDTITVQLGAQNGSGQDGTATITAIDANSVKVTIDIKGGSATPQPAHIHVGTCANLTPAPKYPLTNVVDGKSETTVQVSMADLTASPYAINIHKSGAEVATYVSCGDIKAANMSSGSMASGSMASTTVQLSAQNGSGQDGTATITQVDANSVKVSIDIKGGSATPQPAHIHVGTCANLTPAPKYPLTNVVNGKSETTVQVSMADLTASPYAINIHKSGAEVATYVSCGDIKAANMSGGNMSGGNMAGGSMASTTVQLGAQNGSGQDGTATITEVDANSVKVTIDIKGGSAEPQPAHIHTGTCANLTPAPKYPLTNVVNGKSETTVQVSMADLTKEAYAINIHKSAAEVATYVSCGDIKAMSTGGTTTGGTTTGGTTTGGNMSGGTMPATGNGDQGFFLVGLALLACGLLAAGLRLARTRA